MQHMRMRARTADCQHVCVSYCKHYLHHLSQPQMHLETTAPTPDNSHIYLRRVTDKYCCNDDLAYSRFEASAKKDAHFILLAMLVVLMETIHMTFDAIVIEQLPAMTGVLCQNDCRILKYFESSYTQVFKVAYWGAN